MIRLGILGPGRIVDRVMTDMANAKEVNVTAVASRSIDRAKAAAKRYGFPTAYGSYEEMAKSREVDLVYIATPHPFHAEQAMLMMRNGKHVICEKPMAVNDSETEAMAACARENSVFLMEAMWTRFMPAAIKTKQLADDGEIGEIRHIDANFSYSGQYDEKDRLYNMDLAGGALLDLGVYPLMAITLFLGWKPDSVSAVSFKAPTGADTRMCAQLGFPSGATAQFFCGMDAEADQRLAVYGTEGWLEIPDFWHPTRVILHHGGKQKTFEYPPENEGHHYEFDHAAGCIRNGMTESPVVTLEESIAVSRLCTQMRKQMGIIYPMDFSAKNAGVSGCETGENVP